MEFSPLSGNVPGEEDAMPALHRPVLLREVVHWLACAPGKRMADVTVGLGGHAQAILDACAPDGVLVGLDWDEDALAIARRRLAPGARVRLHHAPASELPTVLAREKMSSVDGVLIDLGLSSLQVDSPQRGFAFQLDGPLDMRMDRRRTVTAAMLVNERSESELADLLRTFGEERWAKAIARAIVAARRAGPLTRTRELAEIARSAIPARFRQPHPHPATRTFQALRIAVNHELDELPVALEAALSVLARGGRLVVIAFHSLEDRIVKQLMKRWEGGCVCPPAFPVCRCGKTRRARILTARPIAPGPEERKENPRSRSAKLRVAERVNGVAA